MNYKKGIAFFINILIIILLLSSCKKEIPAETHQFLQGAWALEGFTDSFRKMHWWRDAFQATGDTIGFIYIDICHDNGKNLKKFFRDSLNYDSLTNEERFSKNSIWILEENDAFNQYAYRLYYKGDDYFLSDILTNGERKYCKIVSRKNKRIEYGTIGKDNNIKAKRYLELLYNVTDWFYERYDYGWDEWYNNGNAHTIFFEKNYLYGVTGVKLYKKSFPKDCLLQTYSLDDINKDKDMGFEYDGKKAWVKYLNSILDSIDWSNIHSPEDFDYKFSLTWKGDTATLKNKRLHGDYYLVLEK